MKEINLSNIILNFIITHHYHSPASDPHLAVFQRVSSHAIDIVSFYQLVNEKRTIAFAFCAKIITHIVREVVRCKIRQKEIRRIAERSLYRCIQ